MASETVQDNLIRLKCVCGQELGLDPELLGRVVRCPQCRRYLRAALQFLLLREERAPNQTALCTCGRLLIAQPRMAGQTVECKICHQRVVLPKATVRPYGGVVRISPRALQRQMNRLLARRERTKGVRPLPARASRGPVKLRPGQVPCANAECGMPLPRGANVCPWCGVNVKTGVRYVGPGPRRDPRGKWRQVRK